MWTNDGTHTWHIPQGVTKVFAFVIGAGGGGYAYNDYYASKIFQGGKGGGYAHGVISGLTPGNTITITVGLGGKGYNRMHSGSGTAGGNSSFGSYLTGNGGGAGAALTSDNGAQRGQGGGASTSGVTEAYTASGGGGGRWFNTTDQYTSHNDGRGVHGGGSSGSPFGNGNGPQRVQGSKCATGGAGWYHGQTWDGRLGGSTQHDKFRMYTIAFPGDGSHYAIAGAALLEMNSGSNDPEASGGPVQGGGGLTSRGGYSYMTGSSGMMIGGQNQAGPWAAYATGFMEGEDKPWWFPWEVDGGGGGAYRGQDADGIQRGLITGGTGGSGAGGGSIMGNNYSYGITYCGGRGGFGGGGGAARASRSHWNNNPSIMHGGAGGIGGGGGAAWTHKDWGTSAHSNDRNHTAFGGHGGNGCVCVYW